MPKNKVNDLITDQEMAFARLVLAGGITDRQAADAAGLNPDSAAYTKSKPTVRAYMLEHRAAVQQQLVQQESEGLRRSNLDREKVLDRLWEIAYLSPEITRGSITGQVKALSMIVAMQNFIPDRRATSSEKKSAPAPVRAEIYASALRRQQAAAIDPQSSPASHQQEDQEEDSLGVAASPGMPRKPQFTPSSAGEAPPAPGPSQSTFVNRLTPSEAPPPCVPLFTSVPDLRVPFLTKNPVNPFVRPR
jgi:hypothetical protein